MIWTQKKFEEEREKFEVEKRRMMELLMEERAKNEELGEQLKVANRAIKKLEKKIEELEMSLLEAEEIEEEEDEIADFDLDDFFRRPTIQPMNPVTPKTVEEPQETQKSWFWSKFTTFFSGKKENEAIKRSIEVQEDEEEDLEPQPKRSRGPEDKEEQEQDDM